MEARTTAGNETDLIGKLFRDKEELAMRYSIDMEYASNPGSSFEKTLRRLKHEMVQLMRCDVNLYKQLTELSNSIHDLKEDFKQFENFRPRVSSFTTTSSTDESFVSAADNLEVASHRFSSKLTLPETSDNRVLSWINNCDQFPNYNDNVSYDDNWLGNHRQRSCSYDGPRSNKVSINSRGNLLSNLKKVVTWRDCEGSLINNSHNLNEIVLHPKLNNSYKSFVQVETKSKNMKTLEEREICSQDILTSYKRSLRLLGSVRMQSRIFEPLHSKYRPFALLRTIESFVSGPTPVSNIQPRPKLHRQNKVLELCDTYLSNEQCQPLTSWTSAPKCQNKQHDSDSSKSQITTESHAVEDKHSENISSDDDVTLNLNDAKVCDDNLLRADSGFNEEFEESTDSELDADNESETEIESFQPQFLYTNDGLVTCRIMSPGLEKELAKRTPESEDFEFLLLVDGRVSFIPHDKGSNSDESYYLAWIFEELEDDVTPQVPSDINDVNSGNVDKVHDTTTCNLFVDDTLKSNCNTGDVVYSKPNVVGDDQELSMLKQQLSDSRDLYECQHSRSGNDSNYTDYEQSVFIGVNGVKRLEHLDQKWSMDSGLGDDVNE